MSALAGAFLTSWPFAPWTLCALLLAAGLYLRGWLSLLQTDARGTSPRWPVRQPLCFVGGLVALYLALASPIEPFSLLFLQAHMVQHLVLLMVAPPLLWLGEPMIPLLRGLPEPVRTYWIAPLFRVTGLRGLFSFLVHPVAALFVLTLATWLWHAPRLYELALRSDPWHYAQHLSFLGAGLLFWYPVVRPFPARPRWSRWLLFPCLLLADVQNTVLSAILTFSDRVLYPHYAEMPELSGLSALDDQAAAGVLMWVPGSLAFLVPLFYLAVRALSPEARQEPRPPVFVALEQASDGPSGRGSRRMSLPLARPASRDWDLLRIPLLGAFLRWRYARLCLQLPIFVLAVAVMWDGLTGPPVAPMNLAGVLPWIHWRGLLIVGLLIVGNVFCLACPFMLPRWLARCWFVPRLSWPVWLRNKWLALVLLAFFLWAYEVFALWDSPWLTAWIAVGYFVAALVLDSLFRGAAFCKYVCPIGQFNFVQSLLSPLEVKVRDPQVCATCQTRDCIRGNATARGCELDLYLPAKASNLDCTLCLDCIHACPHDNIGIISATPAAELWHDPARAGIGRLGSRRDFAALVVLLTFGAFANAAGMVGPVADWQEQQRLGWGLRSPFWPITLFYLGALFVCPVLCVGGAAWLSRWLGGLSWTVAETATRFAYALAPIGFAMWFVHYLFHLLTSHDVIVPATQRFVADLGYNLGTPDWVCSCCRPALDWLPRFEIFCLDVGLLFSLYTAYRIALASRRDGWPVFKALLPWVLLIGALFALGIWILFQPMQMRGTMQMAG